LASKATALALLPEREGVTFVLDNSAVEDERLACL
jgi:hypothetical protein